MLAVDVSGFVVVVEVNGHQMGRRASCLVVIRQVIRSMCIRPHEPQDTYSNHVHYSCTLQLYVSAVRYSCPLQLYITVVRYSCTLQLEFIVEIENKHNLNSNSSHINTQSPTPEYLQRNFPLHAGNK